MLAKWHWPIFIDPGPKGRTWGTQILLISLDGDLGHPPEGDGESN
jgi:hypothetical protein